MNIQEQYAKLSAKLGDLTYKIITLEKEKLEVLEQIKILDGAVGVIKGASNAQKTQAIKESKDGQSGNNSTT